MRRRAFTYTLAAFSLLGLHVEALGQTSCPELMRLRSDAEEALKQTRMVAAPERCYRYNRLSEAWGAVAHYASDNREACHVSVAALDDFERYRDQAIKDRDKVCAGRLLRRYGADIIQY
jgi:hypothetical protein